MITTKAVMNSLLEHAADVESLGVLSRFRVDLRACLAARGDELFELADAVLCADGPVWTLAGLSLVPEHRRGHGALYDAVSRGQIVIGRLRRALAAPPREPGTMARPRKHGGELALADRSPGRTRRSPGARRPPGTGPPRPPPGTGCIPGSPTAPPGWITAETCRSWTER
jgi:hypothetical protein